MTRRIPERATRRSSAPAGVAGIGATAVAAGIKGGCTGTAGAAPGVAAVGCKANTSACVMRPPGPVPASRVRSTPRSAAIFRASGEAFSREPSAPGVGTAAAGGPWRCAGSSLPFPAGAAAFAAGWAGRACAAPSFSPGSSSNAISCPTATFCPSCTKILERTPSSNDSISMVALSVSISAMMSPTFTLSPIFLSHRTRVPSVIVSASLGI